MPVDVLDALRISQYTATRSERAWSTSEPLLLEVGFRSSKTTAPAIPDDKTRRIRIPEHGVTDIVYMKCKVSEGNVLPSGV